MSNASTTRNITETIRAKVPTSKQFRRIMDRINADIVKAASCGAQWIQVNVSLLDMYANYELPEYIDRKTISGDDGCCIIYNKAYDDKVCDFWWSFVYAELVKNGYKIGMTDTYNKFSVWF